MDIDKQSGISHLTPPEARLIGRMFSADESDLAISMHSKIKLRLMDWALETTSQSFVDTFSGSRFGGALIVGYALHAWSEAGENRANIDVELSTAELMLIRNEAQVELEWRQKTASNIDTFMASHAQDMYSDDEEGAEVYKVHAFETDLADIALCGAIIATISRHFGDDKQ